jgi:glycosyltransferase involved in cell wall biosynthesis
MTIHTTRATHTTLPLFFAIPGDINQHTGGYAYDRRLLAELAVLGLELVHLQLSATFPNPDTQALADADAQLSALPEGATVIIDGLALGVMNYIAQKHQHRLRLIGLCHHPLMLESGLTPAQQQQLHHSEQMALHCCTAIIVTSAATRALLIEYFALQAEKIIVAPPGTDRHRFAACSGEPPQLLTLATITRRKGHDVLIDALAQLTHLEWHARFVGGDKFDPRWAETIHQKIRTAGLTERITCTGNLVQVDAEFLRADLFVLPSLFEGYGMAYAEALAFGLPIIATNADAIAQLVPKSAGILVPPKDVTALRAALSHLLTNKSVRAELQAGARAAAEQLPHWNETAQVIAERLNHLFFQTR